MLGLDNPIHILFLLVIVLLVFGAKRLPEMGHSLGSGLRGFKESLGGEGPTTGHLHLEETPAPSVVVPTSVAAQDHAAHDHDAVEPTSVRPAA
jgi:sec-independent protein translocase protein TatA